MRSGLRQKRHCPFASPDIARARQHAQPNGRDEKVRSTLKGIESSRARETVVSPRRYHRFPARWRPKTLLAHGCAERPS